MKSKISFDVSIEVDQTTGVVQAVYFQVRKGKVAETREFENGSAFADYDNAGNLLGVEILAPCKATVFDRIAASEPADSGPVVKKFLKRSAPRDMILTSSAG